MKAINYILGFGAFAAAVVAAIYIGRFAAFAWRCHDIPLAMSCTLGIIWFGAAAVKFGAWAFAGGDAPAPQGRAES